MPSPDKNGNGRSRRRTASACLAALGFLLIPVLGSLDLVTGRDFSFSLFYLIPVVLVTWYSGGRLGAMASVLSAAVWLEAEFRGGHDYSHDFFAWWSAAVRFGFFIVVTVLLARLHAALSREKDLARKDPLTALANRRYFLQRADLELYRARRYGRPLTLSYIDLDNFKDVNDSLGHDRGDALLQSLGRTLRNMVRRTDLAARYGGDEFVLLLPETGPRQAGAAIGNIIGGLNASMEAGGWPVTLSAGVVTYTDPPACVEDAVKAADLLMYEAKKSGKNKVLFRRISLTDGMTDAAAEETVATHS